MNSALKQKSTQTWKSGSFVKSDKLSWMKSHWNDFFFNLSVNEFSYSLQLNSDSIVTCFTQEKTFSDPILSGLVNCMQYSCCPMLSSHSPLFCYMKNICGLACEWMQCVWRRVIQLTERIEWFSVLALDTVNK